MKYNETAKKSVAELKALGKKLREELFFLKLKNVTAQLEKKSQIRQVRRDIARIQTRLSAEGDRAAKA